MDYLQFALSGVIIILLIALLVSVGKISGERKTAQNTENRAAMPMSAGFSGQGGISPEVVAAITAAIASVWEGQNGFVVRHIKRVNNAPAWNRAGREEQVYSRF